MTNINAAQPWLSRSGITDTALLSEVSTYPTSVMRAPLYSAPGGAATITEEIPALDPGEAARFVHVHLFTTDVPVVMGLQFALAAGGAAELPGRSYSIPFVNTGTATPAELGQLTQLDLGLAQTIPAFPCRVSLDDGPFAVAAGAAVPWPTVTATCNAGPAFGFPAGRIAPGGDPNVVDYLPVILLASDYTQAMRENRNVFVDGGIVYVVVGLYSTQII